MRVLLLLLGLSSGPARAVPPPEAYGDELARRMVVDLEALQAAGRHAEAARLGQRFLERVLPAPDVAYEVALAWNRAGERPRALRAYREVVALESTHAAGWYDLGELLLAEGELPAAAEAFGQASELRSDHWAGPFRLAEVAARQHDAEAFEAHLREALRRGFSFQAIVNDPNWRGYMRDAALADVLRRLVTVYSDERLLERLEEPGP